MNRRLALAVLVAAGIALASPSGEAQRASAFPVIVVLHDDAPVYGFAAQYRADARAQADPVAWGYLDRDVAGAVQALEARGGFRADHVYSHALKGFSARLTARQIDELELDPMVAYVEADGTMSVIAQTLPWGIRQDRRRHQLDARRQRLRGDHERQRLHHRHRHREPQRPEQGEPRELRGRPEHRLPWARHARGRHVFGARQHDRRRRSRARHAADRRQGPRAAAAAVRPPASSRGWTGSRPTPRSRPSRT
jgi:hypothetical protein